MFRPSRKRTHPSGKEEDIEGGSDDNSRHEKEQRESPSFATESAPRQQNYSKLTALVPFLFVSILLLLYVRGYSIGRLLLMAIIMIPLSLAACVAAGAWNAQAHARLVALAFCGAIICNQLPSFISAALAAMAVTIFSLSTRPVQVTSESRGIAAASRRRARLFAVCAALSLVLMLLTDNFFVWTVAATYYPSHNGRPEPLQDNGRIVQQYWLEQVLHLSKRHIQQLRATVNIEWALVAGLMAALIVCELQWVRNRSLYTLATRACFTLALARFIRVVSFSMTVLPSQMPNCYRQKFPNPPPADWKSWILVGLLPMASGGCNDLIVSGHATVTSVLACISASVAGHWAVSIAIWSLLAMDFMIEVYEGFHYSVDMWMGAIFTVMLWRILAPIEAYGDDDCVMEKREFEKLSQTTSQDAMMYAIPSVGAYLVLIILPQSIANYCVILYFVAVVVYILRHGIEHYVQHILFCMLYIAFGIFL
jgi:hypothetical protein